MASTSAFSTARIARTDNRGAAPARPLDLTVLRAAEIDAATQAKWHQWQHTNKRLVSGYFHPDFYHAVANVRDDLELAVFHSAGTIQALLPFQRVSQHVAHPAGGMMNDFHGIVSGTGCEIDWGSLLRQARLKKFQFHAWSTSDLLEAPLSCVYETLDSPWIDLSRGWTEYESWLLAHSSTLRRQPQKTRRLQRELGPLRLEMDVRDAGVLEQLIQWKREKFQRTRTFDLLSLDWTANLLREVFQMRGQRFRGLLSALWAGDQMVAAHFGFVCGNNLHYWFPAHSYEHRIYSPGTLLLHEIIRHAGEQNIERIDLGYGPSDLKDRFANRAGSVASGCLGLHRLSRQVDRRRYQLRQLVKQTPFKESIKSVFRPLFPSFGRRAFR